jgi:DNA-binding transcriptional regulator YiaG
MIAIFASSIRFVYNSDVTGSELRRLRRRLKLSQARFADLMGVTANTVARWERDEMRMRPAIDRLVRLTVAEADRQRAGTRKRT